MGRVYSCDLEGMLSSMEKEKSTLARMLELWNARC